MVEHMLHARALKAAAEWCDEEAAAKRAQAVSTEPPAQPPSPNGGSMRWITWRRRSRLLVRHAS